MLEDELREMFSARVSTPPATVDAAGVAIKQGRRSSRRRRVLVGVFALAAFAMLVGSAGMIKSLFTPAPGGLGGDLSYDRLFGLNEPDRGDIANHMGSVSLPVDIRVGNILYTTDGRQLTLEGVSYVSKVVRVPAGWLYSDDTHLRLLAPDNVTHPVGDDVASWIASLDGARVARVSGTGVIEVAAPDGSASVKTTATPDVHPSGFYGPALVVGRDQKGSSYWDGGSAAGLSAWNDRILAFYGAVNDSPLALERESNTTCLAHLISTGSSGWQIGERIGCGGLLNTAANSLGSTSAPTRSPDGRWLAVSTAAGVQLIDLHQTRTDAQSASAGPPLISETCATGPDAQAVWASPTTVITVDSQGGLLLCGVGGMRQTLQLPAGVTSGWELVPRFGMPS